MANVKFGSVMRFVVGSVVASHMGSRGSKKLNPDKVDSLCAMFAMAENLKVSGNQMDYYVSRMPYDVWEVA